MTTIDLDELRSEIEADRNALREKEAVLRFLEARAKQISSRLRQQQPENHAAPMPAQQAVDGRLFALDQLVPADAMRRPLIEQVKDLLPRFGDQEFTVVHVDGALKQDGVELRGAHPRSRLSTVLGKLEEVGMLEKTFQGAGNVPNRYRVKGSSASDTL